MILFLIALPLILTETVGEKCTCVCESEANNTSENKMEGFIVGGQFTTINQFPHSVAMFVHPIETFFCGASVLNQKIILTAAHCVPDKLFRKYTLYVMAGHENLEEVSIARLVRKYIYHAQYNHTSVENDIALMFLTEELPLNTFIKRVAISSTFPFDAQTAEVAGWGTVNDTTKEKSLILKYTSQAIIPLEECRTTYKSDWYPGMMCGGDPNSETDRPSKGDSGSALIVSGYHQIGLVSFRNPELPGLIFYTNISYFYEWIVTQSILHVCLNYEVPVIGQNVNSTTNETL